MLPLKLFRYCKLSGVDFFILLINGFFLFLILLSFFSFISAYELGAGPPRVNFIGHTYENICNSFDIFSKDYNGFIKVEDKWVYSDGLIYNDSLSDFELGINSTYQSRFILDIEKNLDVCLKVEKAGLYEGFLFFKAENGAIELGSRIVANISENTNELFNKEDNEGLNGSNTELSILNILPKNADNMLLIQLSANSILLLVFLVLLVRINRRKRGAE